MEDDWVIKGTKAIRQHRTPRQDLYVPGCIRQKDGKPVTFTDERKTQLINVTTGEMHEFEDNWRQVGPLHMDYEWTGWTELTIVEDSASTGPASSPSSIGPGWTKVSGTPPPASAAVKREATELSGEIDEEDLQPNKSPMIEGEAEDSNMNEVRFGLNMMGFTDEIVNWLLGSDLDVIAEVNEVRRAVRLYGKTSNWFNLMSVKHIRQSVSPEWRIKWD